MSEQQAAAEALGVLHAYAMDAPDAQDAAGMEYVLAAVETVRAALAHLDALAAALEQAEVALNVAEGRGWERCAQATNEAIDRLAADRDALRAAGTAMAEAIGVLLGGGVEMQPSADGPMTFEAMLMLLQMLGVHRGQWRALVPATAAEGGGMT